MMRLRRCVRLLPAERRATMSLGARRFGAACPMLLTARLCRPIIMLAVLSVGGIDPSRAMAQVYPSRPVTIVVPFAAGGNTDNIARLVAQRLGETLGQPFIVEDRPGAAGAIAAEFVARATPDGYTLFMSATPQIAVVPAMHKTQYDPVKDFVPISAIGTNPFVLAVNRKVPVNTIAELIAYVRERPGKLSYASGGVGSLNHLATALFLKRAGVEMIHVPYKGNAPAIYDVVAGNVPVILSTLPDALPQAAAGTIRIIGVTSEQRVTQLPDVPTIAESGFAHFKVLSWNGLLAPAGTPPEIIERLAKQCELAVADRGFRERLAGFGVDPLGSNPADFAAIIAADIALWSEAVKITGLNEP
jgi:tripartite-type tricarboxylate transporter receptor subunit TctC